MAVENNWLSYRDRPGKAVFDARGKKVDNVRSVKIEPDGLRVRILGTVNGGKKAVLKAIPGDFGIECVEFEAFISGATLQPYDFEKARREEKKWFRRYLKPRTWARSP